MRRRRSSGGQKEVVEIRGRGGVLDLRTLPIRKKEGRWQAKHKGSWYPMKMIDGDFVIHVSGPKNKVRRNEGGFSWKNPLGIPWWIWLIGGAGALYFFTRSKAASAAAILPQDATAAALQTQLNTAITAALGYQQGDVLRISFPSATSGPVTVVDNKSGKTVLSTIQAPATLLNFVKAGGLDKYYNQDITDPFTSTGWQKATIVV